VPVNVCIFGDSITWGARLPFRIAWANLLRNHLERVSDNLISLYDMGVDGDTTRELLMRFDVEARARKPDVVIFAVGVNDSLYKKTHDNPGVPIGEFEQNMLELIGKARQFTDRIVVVGLVKGSDDVTRPLVQSTTGKCYDKKRTKEYSETLRSVAEKEKLTFVDVFDRLDDWDFDDGIHPNINGHLKLYEQVRKALDSVLVIKSDIFYTLVDEADNVVGVKKRDSVGEDDIVRVSGLWVTNSRGEILLSRRPFEKRRDPNKWSPAVACVVEKNKTYRSAIIEATRDELGLIGIDPVEGEKLFIDGRNRFYCMMFSLKRDLIITDLQLNSEETQGLRWITERELEKELSEHPYGFVQDFEKYFALYRSKK